MFTIRLEDCVGCGVCVDRCNRKVLMLQDGKATARPNAICNECGHCVAVCPTGAAGLEGYEDEVLVQGGLAQNALSPDALMRAIKGRRSVRRFQKRAVEPEKLRQIVEAGRCSPTGGNRQPLSFAVIQDRMEELKLLAFDALLEAAEIYLTTPDMPAREIAYAHRFKTLGKDYRESGGAIDGLFFNAPAAIGVISDHPLEAGIAASNMELMAFALGLGMVYSGFTTRAAAASASMRELLSVPPGYALDAFLILGYPDVDFLRGAPRKKAQVTCL